jgi:hypothetical protein
MCALISKNQTSNVYCPIVDLPYSILNPELEETVPLTYICVKFCKFCLFSCLPFCGKIFISCRKYHGPGEINNSCVIPYVDFLSLEPMLTR